MQSVAVSMVDAHEVAHAAGSCNDSGPYLVYQSVVRVKREEANRLTVETSGRPPPWALTAVRVARAMATKEV